MERRSLGPAQGRPALELFGATLGLVILGTAAAMLLVSIPGFILAATGADDADPGNLTGWPMLAIGPVLIALGAILGRRMARGSALADARSLVRAALVVVAAVLVAQLFPMFGEGLAPVAAIGVWAVGLTPLWFAVAHLARRPGGPLPWLAVGLGSLLVVGVAVTASIWLGTDAPRTAALAWFPTAVLDPVVRLPLGATDESTRSAIIDTAEFLPHALLAATAFSLWYIRGASRGA